MPNLLIDMTNSIVIQIFRIFVLVFASKKFQNEYQNFQFKLVHEGLGYCYKYFSGCLRGGCVFQYYTRDSGKDNANLIQYPTFSCQLGFINFKNFA